MDRRFTESWCTGKDSNLRTSLGGTDLQSVGFNHSPTCAKIPGRCGRYAPSSRPPCRDAGTAHGGPADTNTLYFRNTGKPRLAHKTPAKITTRRKSSEWSGFGKTCCAATESAEPPENSSLEFPRKLYLIKAGSGFRLQAPVFPFDKLRV